MRTEEKDIISGDETLAEAVKNLVFEDDDAVGYQVIKMSVKHDVTYDFIQVNKRIYLKSVMYSGKKCLAEASQISG